MANIIPLPRYYGPKRPTKRGRPPKSQPKAEVYYFWQYQEQRKIDRETRQTPAQTAYDLYKQATKLDESPDTVQRAIDLYTKALELDPRLSIAHTNLGNIYFRDRSLSVDDRHTKAIYCYERALAIDPNQPEALYNAGYLHLESGRTEQAIAYLQRAIQVDPSFADAHFNLAQALEQRADEKGRPLHSNPHYIDNQRAQLHWREYVRLANAHPDKTEVRWIEIAKRHLACEER